jgi:hypothetical protein
MSRDGSSKASGPSHDVDPYTTLDDHVQLASEMGDAVRSSRLAKAAHAARHRRGEFRWYEFRARRRFRR